MPIVVLNGSERALPEGATIADAVTASGAEPEARGVAVAVDGEVVPRGQWQGRAVPDGSHVEVLRAVQGG